MKYGSVNVIVVDIVMDAIMIGLQKIVNIGVQAIAIFVNMSTHPTMSGSSVDVKLGALVVAANLNEIGIEPLIG